MCGEKLECLSSLINKAQEGKTNGRFFNGSGDSKGLCNYDWKYKAMTVSNTYKYMEFINYGPTYTPIVTKIEVRQLGIRKAVFVRTRRNGGING